MTERHTPDSWDEELDRQLRDALAVDPSPAFRSKLRVRLDAEPVPSRVGGMVPMLAAAAAVAVVVFAGTMGGPWWNFEPAPVRVASRPGIVAAVPYAAPVAPRTLDVLDAREDRRVALRATSDAADASGARVVPAQFAPGERAAFRMFVRLARAGELPVPESLPLAGDGGDLLPAIEIPSIEIPPVIADAGEGVMP